MATPERRACKGSAGAKGWPSARDRFTDAHTAGGAEPAAGEPGACPAARSIRRLAQQLRERAAAGLPDEQEERLAYLAAAEQILAARAALRERRLAVKAYVSQHAGARAVERFFQRHSSDPHFEDLLREYIERRDLANDHAGGVEKRRCLITDRYAAPLRGELGAGPGRPPRRSPCWRR